MRREDRESSLNLFVRQAHRKRAGFQVDVDHVSGLKGRDRSVGRGFG